MIPVQPNVGLFLLPEGSKVVTYAENQPEYIPLPTIKTPDGKVISQWQPDPNELELLKRGVPLTLCLYTFNQPLQPIVIAVGGIDAR